MASFTATDGSKLHYWDIGTGPTCVLVHGFGMPAYLWLPFVLPLAHKYRFVMPDLRGFGGSHDAVVRTDTTFEQYAHDLQELIEHLGEPQVNLAGFSMGACTSMEYQRLYGFDRVRAYLQIDQGMCLANNDDNPWGIFGSQQSNWLGALNELISDFEAVSPDTAFHRIPKKERRALWKNFSNFTRTAFGSSWLKGVAYLGRYEPLVKTVAPTRNWRIYLDCIKTFARAEHDYRPTMSTVTDKPVWFFMGTKSEIYPLAGQLQVRQVIPHAHVVTFDQCGHALMFDAPVRFVRELDHFMQSSLMH